MIYMLAVVLALNLFSSLQATPVVNNTKRRIDFIVVKGSAENPQFDEYVIKRGAQADIKLDDAPVLQFEAYYMNKKGGKAEGKESVYPVLGKECLDCIKSRPGLALSVVSEKIHDVHHRNRRGPAIKVVAPMYMPNVAVAAEESSVDESEMEEGEETMSPSGEETEEVALVETAAPAQEEGEESASEKEEMSEDIDAQDDMMFDEDEEMHMEETSDDE